MRSETVNIIQFPAHGAVVKDNPKAVCFETLRRELQSDEEAAALTLKESAFAPYYGTRDPASLMLPFFAYADLGVTGRAHCLLMPDRGQYFLDHPRDAQDLLWGAHLATCVITEAHWRGSEGNEPWRGLSDPAGYVRNSILDICARLKEAGCDTRILAKLPVVLHTGHVVAAPNASRLELCFSARRRIELVRSAG
jgi:hypothetical protein